MTISILVGIIFLLGSIFILSPGLSSAMRMRTQVGRYPIVKGVISFISLLILISVTFKEHWYEELWRVVVFIAFIFALLQVISTVFTMKFWDGITDFVIKNPLIVSLVMITLGLLLIAPLK